MNRKALAVLTGLLALTAPVACSSQSKATPAAEAQAHASPAPGDTAKVSAPVAVDAKLDGDKARVTLRFDAPASDVRVDVSGVDGLTVKSPARPVDGASFVQSAQSSFDVAFTPGPGRSLLVVAVSGTFQDGHRTKVASFDVGTPTVEQQRSPGTTVTGSDGERVKIMPVDGQPQPR
jgi:hypothetical protein